MIVSNSRPIEYAWYLPSNKRGDATELGKNVVEIPPDFEYLVHIAKTAEKNGLTNILIPCNTSCSDGWLLAAALARETKNLKFCVAIRPGLTSPTFAVQQVNTLDQISKGRVTVNVVPGGSSVLNVTEIFLTMMKDIFVQTNFSLLLNISGILRMKDLIIKGLIIR